MRRRAASSGGAGFWIGVAVGWALIIIGVVGGLTSVTSVTHWLAWLLGGVVAHDLLLAPLVAVFGRVVLQPMTGRLRASVQAALGFSALVVAVALPVALGFGRDPRNPSLLPVNGWAGVTLVVLEGLLVWGLVHSIREARRSLRSP